MASEFIPRFLHFTIKIGIQLMGFVVFLQFLWVWAVALCSNCGVCKCETHSEAMAEGMDSSSNSRLWRIQKQSHGLLASRH